MKDIYQYMAALQEEGQSGALATVVARRGSAPMSGDAKMLVRGDGSIVGTVGGGCLEAEVWQTALQVIEEGTPQKLTFNLTQKEAGDSGHICGGVVDILVEPISGYDRELLWEITDIRTRGGSATLATVVHPGLGEKLAVGRKMLIRRDGSTLGSIPGLEAEVWREGSEVMRGRSPLLLRFDPAPVRQGTRRRQEGDASEVFLEPISSSPTLYLFGGGHVSLNVAQVAHLAGFKVVVVEDRPAFASKERFPMAERLVAGPFPDVFDQLSIDEGDYLAIITRGHANDEVVLGWAVRTPARYIGMIGSKSKVLLTYRRLQQQTELSREEFISRVHAPIGLDVGADTPGEIAVAIVAELIRVRRQAAEEAGLRSAPSKRTSSFKSFNR